MEKGRLVLTRKIAQGLCIGNDIMIRIVDMHNNYAKIMIEAPKGVEIDREEIRIKKLKQRQNKC